jgi:hypothetical protein
MAVIEEITTQGGCIMASKNRSYDSLVEAYENLLRHVGAITSDFSLLLKQVSEDALIRERNYTPQVFDTFLERANSELLSIAFFGAFSSGKSFLISALNKKVDWFQVGGHEQFAPILPVSPRHTSSCPVAVEPLPRKYTEDHFWVWFKDSSDWEKKGPAIEAVIQAYVTDLPNARAKRPTHSDRTRDVIKARLGIASAEMQARLYDLPGIGAAGFEYEELVREFVGQADCLVYIAWAVRPLDKGDLELLRHIYSHHKETGKPVFFVLTQIDLNMNIDSASGRLGWEEVLDANNEFLAENFQVSRAGDDTKVPDSVFMNGGFIPVSAALESKAEHLALQYPSKARELKEESQMENLRKVFDKYLRNTSGPMHLAELASEIQRLLLRLKHDIQARKATESVPLEGARNQIKGYEASRTQLIDGKHPLHEELERLGQATIKRTFAGSDPDHLKTFILEKVSDKIMSSNVLDEKVLNTVETEKMNIVREWIMRDGKALMPRWVGAWDSFVAQSNERLEKLVREATQAQEEAIRGISKNEDADDDNTVLVDIDVVSVERIDPRPQTVRETLDVLSRAWQTWSVVAGLGATGIVSSVATAAAAPALALLGPIGWGLLASAAIGAGYGKVRLKQQLRERRQQMLDEISVYAHEVVTEYRNQINEIISQRIGLLLESLDNEIARLDDQIHSLKQRLLTGEYINREQRIWTLERLLEQCSETEMMIGRFYQMATNIQPNVAAIFTDNSVETSAE